MPIIGLTDRSASFKELGRLRLGIPKDQAAQSGPKEIGYFRPDFRPDAMDAAQVFSQVYGAKPTQVNVRLPFKEIARCWDAHYMVYNKTGLLGMADGERWLYLRHNQTGALLVKDGIPENSADKPVDSNGMPYMPFDKRKPVYSYKSSKGQDVAVFAKPEGRLKVLIPELKRAAFVTVITHSIYNVLRLSEQLAGIDQLAANVGMSLPLVPMVLSRRKELISVSIDGKKAMQEHYLLNIEIDPTWMEAQFKYLSGVVPGALPVLTAVQLLPSPDEVSETDEFVEPDEYWQPEHVANELPATTLPVEKPTESAWKAWHDLVAKAEGLGLTVEVMPETISLAELRGCYKDLSERIKLAANPPG